MIPVSTLYDEYIERRKFTEQKKTHLSIEFLPPQEGRNNNTVNRPNALCDNIENSLIMTNNYEIRTKSYNYKKQKRKN